MIKFQQLKGMLGPLFSFAYDHDGVSSFVLMCDLGHNGLLQAQNIKINKLWNERFETTKPNKSALLKLDSGGTRFYPSTREAETGRSL